MAADRQHHGTTTHRGRALPGRVGRCALALLAAVSVATGPASAEEVFTSQAAASNATDSTWIPAPTRRAAVCIVDTGADTTPDTTNVVARFAMDGSDGSDISPIKHGTLMATIASAPKNDFGMVGAAPSIDVVSVRASRDGIMFGGLDIQSAVQLCVTKRLVYNIKVVSLSLGGDGAVIVASNRQRNEFQDAIDNARLHDLNVVAAAGNEERGVVDWPAGYASTFAVGAATGVGGRCSFASWGLAVDLWSPGCPLDVGRPDETGIPAWANGSSEATAFVAAVIAQMRGLDPELDFGAAERDLLTGARSRQAGPFLEVGAAFSAAGLSTELASGRSATPSSLTTASLGADADSRSPESDLPAIGANVPVVVSTSPPVAAFAGRPMTTPDRLTERLSAPRVRAVEAKHGLLTLSFRARPRSVEAWVEIYARRRHEPFPSIAKRARFRADTLRIRVSGAISQLSIGYRDPTGVRKGSEIVVVHPRT